MRNFAFLFADSTFFISSPFSNLLGKYCSYIAASNGEHQIRELKNCVKGNVKLANKKIPI